MLSHFDLEYQNRDGRLRLRWLMILILVTFSVIMLRLWYLQVVRGDDYFRYAARNSFKAREIPAPRGIIFDSSGNRIADVRPSFDVVIRPDRIRRPPRGREYELPQPDEPVDIRTIAQLLSRYLGILPETVIDKYQTAVGRARYKAVVVKGDVTRDEVAVVESHRIELPGVDVEVSQKRTYPYGELFSHLVGYLGEVHKEELEKLRIRYADSKGEDYYQIGDFIGRYGVERQYEEDLKGQSGVYYVQEDAAGRVVNAFENSTDEDEEYARSVMAYLEERRREALAGNDLVLTIDLDLQRFVTEQMRDKVGSVIVMEAQTGRILSIVNTPSFDPEIFARGISKQEWERLRDDPGHPLEDKALRGQYPPGSTYKMIPAAAAMMERIVNAESSFFCPGSLKIGGRKFRCHRASGHGSVNLHDALVFSCDVYFYSIGPKLGIDRIAQYARAFGLGVPTGLGLNQEKSGLVPTEEWKLKVFKQPWVTGDTVSASIGQGFNLMTPIQLARFTAALANNGKVLRPYVVERIQNFEGTTIKSFAPEVISTVPVSKQVLRNIQLGMLDVVEREGGTAHSSRIPGLQVAGKTGTAQVVRQELSDLGRAKKRIHEDHAWFTSYAPFEDPEIVVSVLIEHGGHGGSVAAPVARAVIKRYFQQRGKLPADVQPVAALSSDTLENEIEVAPPEEEEAAVED